MNITKLNQFIKVAECQNISQAAQALFISQPALSQSIASMEKEFGHRLFERKNKQLFLNEHGKIALQYAHEIVNKYNEMQFSINRTEDADNILRLSGSDDALNALLGAYFMLDHPEIQLISSKSGIHSPLKHLEQRETDLAVHTDFSDSPLTDYIPLLTEKTYVVVPSDSPFYGAGSARLKAFDGCSFYRNCSILSSENNCMAGKRLLSVMEHEQVRLNINYVDFSTLRILWARANRCFFVSVLGLLTNPELSSIDRRRFVLLTDTALSYTYWLSYMRTCKKSVNIFLDWYLSPDNPLPDRLEQNSDVHIMNHPITAVAV